MPGPDEIAKENEQLLIENTRLKRENENLKTQSAKDYDRIAQSDQAIVKLHGERDFAIKQRDINFRNLQTAEKGNANLQREKEDALRLHKGERERHCETNLEMRKIRNRELDWDMERDRFWDRIERLNLDCAATKKTLAEKEALLAGADQEQQELQKSLQVAEEEVEKNKEAAVWLGVISNGLDHSFISLGQELTPENLVERYLELERKQHRRATSGNSLLGDELGQFLPKHRLTGSEARKISLGDELDRATGDEDGQSDEDFDGEVITSEIDESLHSSLLAAREPAEQAKKESEEKGERIKALEEELSARPANGNSVGTVVAPAAEEKVWWEALWDAPLWAKLVWLLLALLWATATIGAIHERQRWVWANVTPEMVRFYASPPTLDGVIGGMAGRGHGFGLHG